MRGKNPRTTIPDSTRPCPLDRVNRKFHAPAPSVLWVNDFTYVATWKGFVYVAFVIEVFAQRIVGWRASRTAHARFALDALGQASHQRRTAQDKLIHRRRPWRSFEAVEYATLEWVDWFNNRRLLEPIGNIPPAEAEANFYAPLERSDMARYLEQNSLRQARRGSIWL